MSLCCVLAPTLMRRVSSASSLTPSTSSFRCRCRGSWRTLRPSTSRLKPSTPPERWRSRWASHPWPYEEDKTGLSWDFTRREQTTFCYRTQATCYGYIRDIREQTYSLDSVKTLVSDLVVQYPAPPTPNPSGADRHSVLVCFCFSLVTCWSSSRSTCPNPPTGSGTVPPLPWCPMRPDSGT